MKHYWIPSNLGYGEAMCRNCRMTNREAWALGDECGSTYEPKVCSPVEAVILPFQPRSERRDAVASLPSATDEFIASATGLPTNEDKP